LERAKQPDYVSRYDDFDLDYGDCRRAGATAGESRVDGAHQRAGAPAAHFRSASNDGARGRSAAPPPKSSRGSSRQEHDGFGAGIFPDG